jgi:hypothetical protein
MKHLIAEVPHASDRRDVLRRDRPHASRVCPAGATQGGHKDAYCNSTGQIQVTSGGMIELTCTSTIDSSGRRVARRRPRSRRPRTPSPTPDATQPPSECSGLTPPDGFESRRARRSPTRTPAPCTQARLASCIVSASEGRERPSTTRLLQQGDRPGTPDRDDRAVGDLQVPGRHDVLHQRRGRSRQRARRAGFPCGGINGAATVPTTGASRLELRVQDRQLAHLVTSTCASERLPRGQNCEVSYYHSEF